MRDVLHGLATMLVIAVAALCALVQLDHADLAFSRLGGDDAVVQQVSSSRHDNGHQRQQDRQDRQRSDGSDSAR